uniref:DZF domain-containing protein n=1 Tax=Paramormyrops kingsleyae TaxID=1676925 RepID=A0A3B3S4F9_9TELE
MELLCEKAIGTGIRPMGAGEALRRVLECLASGILLQGNPGLPCGHYFTAEQQRENITQSAQLLVGCRGATRAPLPQCKVFTIHIARTLDRTRRTSASIMEQVASPATAPLTPVR